MGKEENEKEREREKERKREMAFFLKNSTPRLAEREEKRQTFHSH